MKFKFRFAFLLAGMAVLAMSYTASAQEELPSGAFLMDNYVKVTGGVDAYKKIKNRMAKGSIKLAGQEGAITVYQKEPNLMYVAFNLQGFGKFESGTNGKIVWENNPITGAKLQTGSEKSKLLRTAAMDGDYNWKKYFKTAKTVEEVMVDGKPTYKVKLVTNDGYESFRFFDKKSGLVVKMTSKVKSQLGEVETESTISDYRKVDGLLISFKAVQSVLGQEVVIQLK